MGTFRKEGREPGKGNKDIVFKRLKAEQNVKVKHEMTENGHRRRDTRHKILKRLRIDGCFCRGLVLAEYHAS